MTSTPALYDALAKARLEFGTVVKDKTAKIASQKGAYSYTYADLASVIEATAPALAKHGLSIIQEPEVSRENDYVWLTLHGSLCHAGGEVVPFRPLTMPVGTSADARTIGTAISYARRYQLISVLNIAAEADDDDGAGNGALPAKSLPQRSQSVQHEEPTFYAHNDGKTPIREVTHPTQARLDRMHALGSRIYGPDWEERRHKMAEAVSKGATTSSKALSANEVEKLIKGMEVKEAELAALAAQPSPFAHAVAAEPHEPVTA